MRRSCHSSCGRCMKVTRSVACDWNHATEFDSEFPLAGVPIAAPWMLTYRLFAAVFSAPSW